MGYFVYILQSEKDGSYYIGSSNDPQSRLEKHNKPHSGYTGRKQPWKIVHTEEYTSKTEAQKREKYLKRMKSKDLIIRLIGSSAGFPIAIGSLSRASAREGRGFESVSRCSGQAIPQALEFSLRLFLFLS